VHAGGWVTRGWDKLTGKVSLEMMSKSRKSEICKCSEVLISGSVRLISGKRRRFWHATHDCVAISGKHKIQMIGYVGEYIADERGWMSVKTLWSNDAVRRQ